MSFTEIIFFGVLALLVFGPRRLPEIARLVGKTMGELRRASNEFRNSLEEEIRNIEYQDSVKKAQSSLPPVETTMETESAVSETAVTGEPGSTAPYSPVEHHVEHHVESHIEHSVATDPYAMTAATPEVDAPAEAPEHALPDGAAPSQDVPEATLQDPARR